MLRLFHDHILIMDKLKEFCSGSPNREIKDFYFKEFMNKSAINSVEMLTDKRDFNKRHNGYWAFRLALYFSIGIGYYHILNIFRPLVYAKFIFPAITCLSFGYFDYFEEKYQAYKIADKYEIQTHNFFCKKT